MGLCQDLKSQQNERYIWSSFQSSDEKNNKSPPLNIEREAPKGKRLGPIASPKKKTRSNLGHEYSWALGIHCLANTPLIPLEVMWENPAFLMKHFQKAPSSYRSITYFAK